jgi:signal transduction histidine kinase
LGELIAQLLAPQFLLDWATMAVSLFNTIILLWLGTTVLVNSERRAWGVWLAGGGLLLAGFFFVSHSAMLGHGLSDVGSGMDFWWQVGWVPVVTLPFAWYMVMLWYSGFWDASQTPLHRRHRFLFALALIAFGFLASLFLISNPLPPYNELGLLSEGISRPAWGLQVLAFLFPTYAVLCMGLSVDVVARPGPTDRLMGDLARRRARPWLAATSFVLLGVSLLVAGTTIWLVANAGQGQFADIHKGLQTFVYWFDLLTSALIAAAAVLLGQAIVAYEIFTGKTLPRRGFVRQWRVAVLFAVIYAGIVGASLARQTHPIAGVSGLLLITVLMSLFFAFFSWRSYTERDRYISYLRPFVTSQGLYDELLATSSTTDDRLPAMHGTGNGQAPSSGALPNGRRHLSPDVDVTVPFYALCHDVLGVKVAYLVAVGPLSPLVGPPLTYPSGQPAKLPPLTGITSGLDSPQTMYVPVEPARYGGATLAVPLWSERGLIGVLLLGEKADDGLYAQEEIEIARAAGERLIDTQASAQMAQRLMLLQRQRLSESQVLDRRARRVLHDDVLPLLHTAMLELSRRPTTDDRPPAIAEANGVVTTQSSDPLSLLADAHRQISDLLRDMPPTVAPEMARLGLVGALRKAVDEELAGAFDGVTWQIDPQVAQHAADIPPLAAEVIYYATREAIRNSARYGRSGDPRRPLHLKIAVLWHNGLEILVEDDGVGLSAGDGRRTSDDEGRRTKDEGFRAENSNGHANGSNGANGSSSSNGLNGATGGSGQGLALHSTMMAVVGGSLSADSVPGEYTRVVMSLPVDS